MQVGLDEPKALLQRTSWNMILYFPEETLHSYPASEDCHCAWRMSDLHDVSSPPTKRRKGQKEGSNDSAAEFYFRKSLHWHSSLVSLMLLGLLKLKCTLCQNPPLYEILRTQKICCSQKISENQTRNNSMVKQIS